MSFQRCVSVDTAWELSKIYVFDPNLTHSDHGSPVHVTLLVVLGDISARDPTIWQWNLGA